MASPIPVNIVKRIGPADRIGTKFTVYVAPDGSLAELRTVLVEDEVADPGDKFYVEGRALGKSSEANVKWTAALKVRPEIWLDS